MKFMRKGTQACAGVLALVLCLSQLGCDEALPPRDEPKNFMKASISVDTALVVVEVDSTLFPHPETITGTPGSFRLSLTSYYPEVLEDEAYVQCFIEVWLASQPSVQTRVEAGQINVEFPFIGPDNMITLEPGDSVYLTKQWDHKATNGRGFYRFVPMRTGVDGNRRPYFESAPVRMVARATIQAFKNVQPEQTELYEFALTYRLYVRYPP